MGKLGEKAQDGIGLGCVTLFALPFAAVGCFAIGLAARETYDWWRMRDWPEVRATILEARLKGNEIPKPVARYEYVFQGQKHIATRIAIANYGTDNVGDFQVRVGRELQQFARNGQPFRCFVNPANPSEAILYRNLRVGLVVLKVVFGLLFGGIGAYLLGGTWLIARPQLKEERRRKQQYPDEPWRWKSEWDGGHVKSSASTNAFRAVFIAAFWNLIAWPTAIVSIFNPPDDWWVFPIIWLFPAIGIGLAVWAARNSARWRKFGTSVFEMATTPGVIGGPLAGVIRVNRKLRPQRGYKLTLNYLVESGSGDSRSEQVRWQAEKLLDRELLPDSDIETAIPVQFAIPNHLQATTLDPEETEVTWRLEVAADDAGIDFQDEFNVPVFRTADSSSSYTLDESLLAPFVAQRPASQFLTAAGIRTEPAAGGGKRFVFPLGRHVGASLGITAFAIVFASAAVAIHREGAPWFFEWLFGGCALLLVFGALDFWLWTSDILVRGDEVTIRAGWFGKRKEIRIPRDEVDRIDARRAAKSGTVISHDLHLLTIDGKRHTIGKRIRSTMRAEKIAEEILRVIQGDPAEY